MSHPSICWDNPACWHPRDRRGSPTESVAGLRYRPARGDDVRPVRLWLRSELRTRWKALAGVALLLGLAGGTVIAATAAARRTATAYDRFLVAQNAADVTILDDGSIGINVALDKIIALPQVESYARTSLIMYVKNDHAAVASVDDRLGRTINKLKIISGRMYDSSKVEEVVLGFGVARDLKMTVGSTFTFIDSAYEEALAKQGLTNTMLKVVGIAAGSGEFPPQYRGLYPSVHLTPALFKKYGNEFAQNDVGTASGCLFIKLKRGAVDVPAFRAAVEKLAPDQPVDPISASELGIATRRSFHFQAIGLWLLAAFGALATVLVGGQALARQAFLGATDFPTLNALGFRRGELVTIGLLRALIVGSASAVVAVVVAIALSPLAPVGDARIAEPNPGVSFDVTAIGIGVGALIALAVALAAFPAWNAARTRSVNVSEEPASTCGSRIAAYLARISAPASGVAGARLALEKGRGRTAVPVRSSIAGAAFGLAVLIGATTFGASLNHLIGTPALYGASWDAFLTNYGDGEDLRDHVDELLAAKGVTDITIAGDLPLLIGGRPLLSFGTRALRGDAGPPIVAGSAPRRADEIALTSRTARRVHAKIGDRIRLRVAVAATPMTTFTVVGTTVIPPFGFVNAEPGEGALLTLDGMVRLIPEQFLTEITLASDAMIRFAPGVDREKVIQSLGPFFGRDPNEFGEGPRDTPADVVSFGHVQNLPLILGIILGIVASATLAHTTMSSVRRRRRDLAILKTLGFERRQLRATVAWQATALSLVAMFLAVPAGIAFGRWTWRLLANQVSVVPEPVVPAILTAVIAAAALILANLIAAIPGRTAARLQPALILRTE